MYVWSIGVSMEVCSIETTTVFNGKMTHWLRLAYNGSINAKSAEANRSVQTDFASHAGRVPSLILSYYDGC